MLTECNGTPILFQAHGRREVTADGGALLLREADNVFGVAGRLELGIPERAAATVCWSRCSWRRTAPEEIVLDFDATDDPLHGA